MRNRYRRQFALWPVLALLALVGFFSTSRAAADPVSIPQLAAATLGPADLSGWATVNEMPPAQTDDQTYDVVFHRLLAAQNPAANAYATLDLQVQVLASGVPAQIVAAYINNAHTFDKFSTMRDFRVTGALGVGNIDNSMYFVTSLPNTTALYAIYVDVFLRGRMVLIVRYGAIAGQDDPTALARLARQQDHKLTGSTVLPPALLNPLANPTSLASHRWYTSTDPAATLYYCDDDPAWRSLDLASLDSFGTAGDLLAAYPGRTLNQRCGDGATGP